MSPSPAAGIAVAEAAFLAGELDQAESLCRALLQQDGSSAEACHLLGAVALRRGNPREALDWIERALKEGLATPIVLNNCGEAYRQLGRLDEAFARFEQALRIDNLNPYPHFNLGLLMRARGSAREAEHFFRSALIADPGMGRAHFELAELYREEGHWPEAEREYRDAIAKGGAQASVGNFSEDRWAARLGSLLLERGTPQVAIDVLREALARYGDSAFVLHELAKAQFELCWERDAEVSYRRAVATMPALGLHVPPRVVSARTTAFQAWCEQEHGRFTRLARPQWLSLAPFKAIPADSARSFSVGAPAAPELFSVQMDNAEVLPREFAVLAEGRLFLYGIVNWAQHYAQKGRFARHSTDDLRVLLDLPGRMHEHDGACVVLGGDGDHYHWMFETLARRWAIEQQPELADLPLVVSADLPEARLAMLDALEIRRDRLLPLGDEFTLRAKVLHVPSLLTVGDWVSPLGLQYLRRRLSGTPVRERRRIFLSRREAPDRRLANEDELRPILDRHGFEIVDVEKTPFLDLLRILSTAEAVLGLDDEALAGLVVVPQSARVGVIGTGGIYRPRAYFISGQLGHEFAYLASEVQFASSSVHALCDVILPASTLQAFLQGM